MQFSIKHLLIIVPITVLAIFAARTWLTPNFEFQSTENVVVFSKTDCATAARNLEFTYEFEKVHIRVKSIPDESLTQNTARRFHISIKGRYGPEWPCLPFSQKQLTDSIARSLRYRTSSECLPKFSRFNLVGTNGKFKQD
jgi:hypothetical protein